MIRAIAPLAIAAFVSLGPTAVLAEPPPPQGAKPLSEIARTIEARPDFAHFEEIEWEDGRYEVEYITREGAKVKIRINPTTGQPR